MSFGVYIDDGDVEYAGSGLNTLFAQRRNLARPAHWKMLGEILRFNSLSFASSSSGKAASAAVQLQICFIRSASVRLCVITTCCRWPQQSGHARPGPCLFSPSRALPISSGTTGCLICAIDPNGAVLSATDVSMSGESLTISADEPANAVLFALSGDTARAWTSFSKMEAGVRLTGPSSPRMSTRHSACWRIRQARNQCCRAVSAIRKTVLSCTVIRNSCVIHAVSDRMELPCRHP